MVDVVRCFLASHMRSYSKLSDQLSKLCRRLRLKTDVEQDKQFSQVNMNVFSDFSEMVSVEC